MVVAINSGRHLPAVQIMRAVAALCVVGGHAAYEAQSFAGAQVHAIAPIGELGFAGVDLFFVVSGFIMMWSFGNRFGQSGAAQAFLIRRLIRIVPLYWFFTGLMILALIVVPDRIETTSFTPVHALLSATFIPHLAPQGGLHPILLHGWTLIYEMFFYAVFAMALFMPRRIGVTVLIVLFAGLNILATRSHAFPAALEMFFADPIIFEFLLGMGFFFVQRDGELSREALSLLLAGCLLVGGSAHLAGLASGNRFFEYGLPAFACFAIGYHLFSKVEARFWMLLVLLGEASYSLYLSHPFTLELVKMAFLSAPLEGSAQLTLYLTTGIALAAVASIALWSALERPVTHRLSRLTFDPVRRAPTGV